MEKITDDELISLVDKEEFAGFGVGLHGIGLNRDYTENTDKDKDKIARSIMEKGLKLGAGYRSINGNVYGIGIVKKNNDTIKKYLSDYIWGSGQQTNVLVVYPPVVQNSQGKELFLGYTYYPTGGYDQNNPRSLMDIVCSKLGYVPNEFIMGYYRDTENKYGTLEEGDHITYDFENNPYFCNGNTISDELFDKINDSLDIYYKQISDECLNALNTFNTSDLDNLLRLSLESRYELLNDGILRCVNEQIEIEMNEMCKFAEQMESVLKQEEPVSEDLDKDASDIDLSTIELRDLGIDTDIANSELTSGGIKTIARDSSVVLENAHAQSVIDEYEREEEHDKTKDNGIKR